MAKAFSVATDLAGLDSVPPAPPEYRLAFNMRVARAETPWLIRWWVLVFAAVSLLDHALIGGLDLGTTLAHAGVIALLLIASFVLESPRIPDRVLPWLFAATSTVVAMIFVLDFDTVGSAGRLALAVIVVATCTPSAQAWLPFLASVIVIIGTNVLLIGSSEILPLVAAALAAGFVLWLRLRSLQRQADVTYLANTLATTDVLTGALNRHGLERTLPRLLATATRLVQPVMVWHVEIDGIRQVNRAHGRDVGDDLIRATADAIRVHVRGDDLVARVAGDEFLVIGLGTVPDGHDFPRLVVEAVRAKGIAADVWPGTLSYGAASGLLSITDVPTLIAQADAQLAERRESAGAN